MTSRFHALAKSARFDPNRNVRLSSSSHQLRASFSSWSIKSRNRDEMNKKTPSSNPELPASFFRSKRRPGLNFQTLPSQFDHSSSLHHLHWARNFSTASLNAPEDDGTITYDSVMARANVKTNVLNDAKRVADKAKGIYQSSNKSTTELSPESLENIRNNWIEKEVELADAYSKAIKYIARLRTKDVARKSQLLLDDMLSRHGTVQEESTFLPGHDGPQFSERTVFDLLNAIEEDPSRSSSGLTTAAVSLRDGIPVPGMKDFSNVLHSWASSKVKRKGVYGESLLYRMMELGYFYPENFPMPDSKTFGLVIKCYAGSTFKDALRSIQRLHKVHEKLGDMNTPGITKDDPFLLMHSIKSISNYTSTEETALVDEWFTRLHKQVMDHSNSRSFESSDGQHPEVESGTKEALDLTGTYTNIIRNYSKLRGQPGAAGKAFHALQRMKDLSDGNSDVATIDLKVNAFNMVLRTEDSSNDKLFAKKLELLDLMIESGRESNCALGSTPMPTDQSFASCIKSVSVIKDPIAAINETDKLIDSFEALAKEGSIPPSPKPYNAAIELYLNLYGSDKASAERLLSICDGIKKRMHNLTPRIHPDNFTSLAFLKACACDDGIMDNRRKRMEQAEQIFLDMSKKGDNQESELNDKFYYYMMKCVVKNVASPEEEKQRINELFSKACNDGFVSANVLKMLRAHTTTEEYCAIVGSGRLADNWIANVTSGVAVYTDGTAGGEGKNARRKGKSTSNWAKKHREREDAMLSRKDAKVEKKRLKLKREEKGKRRRP